MSKWREGVLAFYDGPQPTECGLTDEELRGFYRGFLMDDKPWRVAGELLTLRAEVERLTQAWNHEAVVSEKRAEERNRAEREVERLMARVAALTEALVRVDAAMRELRPICTDGGDIADALDSFIPHVRAALAADKETT